MITTIPTPMTQAGGPQLVVEVIAPEVELDRRALLAGEENLLGLPQIRLELFPLFAGRPPRRALVLAEVVVE